MDEVDRVAFRVSMAGLTGCVGGVSLATLKGYPMLQSAFTTATSCAMVGTACFGFERLANVAMRKVVDTRDEQTKTIVFYASHAIGGMIGGAITSTLFQRRPLPGMILCTPLMLGVAFAELSFEAERQKRLEEMRVGQSSVSSRTKDDDARS